MRRHRDWVFIHSFYAKENAAGTNKAWHNAKNSFKKGGESAQVCIPIRLVQSLLNFREWKHDLRDKNVTTLHKFIWKYRKEIKNQLSHCPKIPFIVTYYAHKCMWILICTPIRIWMLICELMYRLNRFHFHIIYNSKDWEKLDNLTKYFLSL